MTPRGIRLNNPGNLVKSSAPWAGKIAGADERFETFDTPFHGISALCKQLVINQDQHSITTTAGQISRWAPPTENDTAAYIATVAKSLGRGPNDQIDMHNIVMLVALAKAIIQVENGQQPYADELIMGAAREALGNVGTRAQQPTPAPIQLPPNQPRTRMGAELLVSLIPSVLSLFTGRAQAAIAKATGDPTASAKFVQDISAQIQSIAGVPVTDQASAIRAVAAVANDPAKVAALEAHATAFVLTEIGGGIQGARDQYNAIARDYDDDSYGKVLAKFLANPIHWVTGVFLFWIQQFVPALVAKVAALDGAAALGLIMLIFSVIAIVAAFWLGNYFKQQNE